MVLDIKRRVLDQYRSTKSPPSPKTIPLALTIANHTPYPCHPEGFIIRWSACTNQTTPLEAHTSVLHSLLDSKATRALILRMSEATTESTLTSMLSHWPQLSKSVIGNELPKVANVLNTIEVGKVVWPCDLEICHYLDESGKFRVRSVPHERSTQVSLSISVQTKITCNISHRTNRDLDLINYKSQS